MALAMVDVATDADLFTGRAWFAVVSKPGRQELVRDGLARQGYGAFLPMCLQRITHARKVEDVLRPLLGRYVFVGIGDRQPFDPIRHARGVAYVGCNGGRIPLRVPIAALRKLHERCEDDGGAVDLRPKTPIKKRLTWAARTELQITDGPLAGMVAVFQEEAAGAEAARVLVELFGRPSMATIPVASLRKVTF